LLEHIFLITEQENVKQGFSEKGVVTNVLHHAFDVHPTTCTWLYNTWFMSIRKLFNNGC